MCSGSNFEGYHFRKFKLPEKLDFGSELKNDTEVASWYYLNQLDAFSCIDGCLTFEDYSNIKNVPEEELSPPEV
jgi:hypothetical protein